MGLIERVVSDGPSGPERPQRPSAAAAGPQFDLDFEALAARGAFTPDGFGRAHVLELRAIKRALLKRIGLLHGGARRGTRGAGRSRNVIVVTSTRPGEGKTFTSVNLALSLALEEKASVLLIDGDALKPKVRSYFDLPEGPGFVDRLADPKLSVASLAWRARQAPLAILGEGATRGPAADLFASDDARAFFARASAAAPDRLIIVDAPPMLATTEAFALARHADEVLFVVQADATPQQAVAMALDELLEANPSVSLVLNRCLVPGGGAHYGSYGEYYTRAPGGGAASEEERPRSD
ncbi:MAG: hypothetical protein AAFX08_03160 [Pseudomonadota bacterium]